MNMSRASHSQIAGFDTVVKLGTDDGPALVLLHGFGADAEDLVSLAPLLSFDEKLSIYFPEGPMEVRIGFGETGQAWFPIPLSQLNDGFDFESVKPQGLDSIAARIEKFISYIPHENVVIGGFSQGAMVATHIFLKNPQKYKGLVALSGTLCNKPEWQEFGKRNPERPPVFQTHGQYDPVLTFHQAQKLDSFLRTQNYPIQFYSFNGRHEIPQEAIRRLKLFLAQTLKEG